VANSVRVFANDGTGALGLGAGVPATVGRDFRGAALGDVDGDGARDLILPSSRSEVTTVRSLALPAEAVCFGGCLTVPAASCVEMERARLQLSERKTGSEKLKLALKSPLGAVPAGFLGDPASGTTRVDVCVYDDADTLVGEFGVDRGGDACGPKAKPCWKALGSTGFAYKDPDAASSGMRKIKAKSRRPEKTQLSFQAGNKARKGQDHLPLGLAAALESAARARVQVLTTDGACFDAALPTVKKADGVQFDARVP
jgi:hypothetical protein